MKALICQSCGLSFLKSLGGVNRDETKNEEFCIKCFDKGEFTDCSLSLHKLETKLIEMAKFHNDITLEEVQLIIKNLPYLKRWQMNIM